MMYVIEAHNVNDALEHGISLLKMDGREEPSRNGPVIVMPGPVTTVYERPWERVLFSAARDANPVFHLFESIWMLAGSNEVGKVANYARRMAEFSDDGEHLHGAYGFRWRAWFGIDQLQLLIEHLIEEPNSRRAVLTMWSPLGDLVASEGAGGLSSKDIPCNTQAYFRIRKGALTMTVMARSNDLVWGSTGANAVHFSMLQEFMARAIGVEIGPMYQLSNDLHIYKSLPQFAALWNAGPGSNPYAVQQTYPIMIPGERAADFLWDCEALVKGGVSHFKTAFFTTIAYPMMRAHAAWRAGGDWRAELDNMPRCDWQTAGREWLERRTGE
jgi:thymidylate synthase